MSNQNLGGIITKTPTPPNSISASGVWTLSQQMAAQAAGNWPFPRDPYFKNVTMLLHGDGASQALTGAGAGTSSSIAPFNSDASANNFNLTINGEARSNNFNPYSSNYYSNYFNGFGSYLSLNAQSAFTFTGDFTIECWVYITSIATYAGILETRSAVNSSPMVFGVYALNGGNRLDFFYGSSRVTSSFFVPLNQFVHVAVTRSGSTIRLFINGALDNSTATVSGTITPSGTTQYIGALLDGNGFNLNGFISNLRVVKGTALYTSSFTPSTTPLTAVTNTSLLTCQSNRFSDNSTNNYTITSVGTPSVTFAQQFTLPSSTATYGAGYFDGSTAYLTAASNAAFALGTGDFTIELWYYMSATTGVNQHLIDMRGNSFNATAPLLYVSTSNVVVFYTNGANQIANTTISVGAWYHIALSRSGTTTRLFVNGILSGSITDTNNYVQSSVYLGRASDGNTGYLYGYETDVRIVKGTAVYTSAFTPPTVPLTAITNTSLLTNQFGSNANNNGFVDISQNNFPVTRTGALSQGTFTPYGSNWGNYFGATGQYLSVPYSSAFNLTGDFTIECWINPGNLPSSTGTAAQSYERIFSFGTYNAANSLGLEINSNDSGNVRALIIWYNATYNVVSTNNAVAPGVWYHIAIVRSGTTITTYINGTSTGLTITGASAAVNTSQSFYIATLQGFEGDASAAYNGYISNFRIVKGTAVYTSNFTPSTTPLTAISGTSLLTCQSSRFIDSSTNAYTVTVNGSPSVQRFSPFAPLSVYNPALNGASTYFPSTSTYLYVPPNSQTAFVSNNFTIEMWLYLNDGASNSLQAFYTNYTTFSDPGSIYFGKHTNYSGRVALWISNYSTGGALLVESTLPPSQQWVHYAVTRNGNVFKIYRNGVQTATTNATTFTGDATAATNPNYICTAGDFVSLTTIGYMTDFRIVNGSAVYLSGFVPNTTPLTPIQGTALLTSPVLEGVVDNSMQNVLQTVGNAQVSTSVKKYGTGSMYFDGSGDYLDAPTSASFGFNTGDYTVEFWIYLNTLPASKYTVIDFRTAAGAQPHTIYVTSSGYFGFYNGSTDVTSSSQPISASGWYHVAYSRGSGTLKIFVSGTQAYSASNTIDYGSSKHLRVGGSIDGAAGNEALNGYIDDLRITKGYARYTGNFTPPTEAFPNG